MSTKRIKIILWVCVAILAVQFFAAGAGKMAGLWTTKFANWAYPMPFMYLIGLMEIVGAVGLFWRRTREWSSVMLILIMIGAGYTMIANGEGARVMHPVVLVIILAMVITAGRRLKPN